MFSRKSDLFILLIAICISFFIIIVVHASLKKKSELHALREMTEMVRMLELTDLCLFTDARYTRHPSMADLHTPFQDHPVSFEHFPSGALVTPPPHLRHHVLDR